MGTTLSYAAKCWAALGPLIQVESRYTEVMYVAFGLMSSPKTDPVG